ncbi:MAG: AAA family ATPase [Planctomycetaceae bacterium]|nr:AAA family ATPase [Planctomycetaceae bacterium]
MFQAFVFRRDPNASQRRRLEAVRETCRRFYNTLLRQRKDAYELRGVFQNVVADLDNRHPPRLWSDSKLLPGATPVRYLGVEPPVAPGNGQPTEGALVTITLLNQKGGVGKTSTCHHLAGTLAQLGRRVLLVDNDPQSSLTQGLWGPSVALSVDPAETIAAVYSGDSIAERIIKPSGVAGVDLIPGSVRSTRHNVPVPEEAGWDAQTCLRSFLDEVRGQYDLTLIDCPPNLHLCSWAALVASDWLIVPLQPEDYGAQGIAEVQDSAARVVAGLNPSLRLLGYLVTMVQPRRTVHQLYEGQLRSAYGDDVFAARIPEAAEFVEAVARRLPIALHKPKGAAAKAVKALAEELLARLESRAVARGNTEAA